MNREAAPYQLQDGEYSFSLNSNIQNESGNVLNITNEHSNILASKFVDGYKVVGFRNNLVEDRTYFFLTNPTTGVSEFGVINNSSTELDLSDTETDCDGCNFINELSEPLENINQPETQVYTTLLEDSCNLAFNFDIRFPMKGIEIKDEKCGETIYFTDALNPPRYIQIDNLDQYLTTGVEVCGDDSNVEATCLNAERMRIFKFFTIPEITPAEVVLGGRLRRGTYEFLVAYCDNLGNEISEYYSVTNPVAIFDTDDVVLEQSETSNRTNFGIRLNLENLDTEYRYYKVAVIQNTDLDGAISYFIEGLHPTTDTTIIYNTEENKERTDLINLSQVKTTINTWEGLTQSNGYLFGYGLTAEKEINLQPVVNLMGAFLKWQTGVAREQLYEDGVANALYKGYQRDEVYPFSIRFLTTDGFTTALFPFIARPAIDYDYIDENQNPQTINEKDPMPDNQDFQSIVNNTPTCTDNVRDEFWQFYNTGTADGFCESDIDSVEVVEDITKICFIEAVETLPAGNFVLEVDEEFTNLEDYINDNINSCADIDIPNLCDALDPANYPDNCTPNFIDCDTPILISEEMVVSEVINGNNVFVEKDSTPLGTAGVSRPEGYVRTLPPSFCDQFERDNNANVVIDQDFTDCAGLDDGNPLTPTPDVYKRKTNFFNDECDYAVDMINIAQENTQVNNFGGYFHGLECEATLAEMQTGYDSFLTGTSGSAQFTSQVHKGGLWFRGDINNREKLVLEITRQGDCSDQDDISNNDFVRLNIFDSCNDTVPVYGEIVDLTVGSQIQIDVSALGLTGNSFFVVVDLPIIENTSGAGSWFVFPTCGCFGMFTRDIEFKEIQISYDGIVFDKKETYEASCTFQVPVVDDCDPQPYQFGKFSYWESTEEYPDNKELYDSSALLVDESQFPASIKAEFENYYTDGVDGDGNYIWREDGGKALTDFTCQPIRHYKFPDNKVTSFMSDTAQSPFSDSVIFPIGITIDENIINHFLDVAVENALITQEQRDRIVGYEIFRGDRALEKSVLAKGLLYDMYKYPRKNKDTYFSNFPFNALGENNLVYETEDRNNFIQHPFDSDGNNRFTFHSPENHFTVLSGVGELKVESYQFGNSRGFFSDVEDHPKWVILGSDAYSLANTLAIAEIVAEALVASMQAFANYNQIAGLANTVFSGAWVAAPAIAAALGISGAIFNYGRYRYEWLTIFRDLGQPENFASYYAAEGRYNYSLTEDAIGNTLRGVSTNRRLKAGNFSTTDSDTGENVKINNLDREYSHYVYLGDGFNIDYPDFYKNYDNHDVDFNSSSRGFLSETEECQTGISNEIEKNIASPYVSLKSYRPSQYGTVDSIKWITTSYQGMLREPKDSCFTIYGGDTYIARMTLKRKVPMFVRNSMNQASLTPFNYGFYNNIGDPRFFCNYEVTEEVDLSGSIFPEFGSEYNFDCLTGNRDFYVRPPSKFYLFYYGIPNFLVETDINLNYRNARREPRENFFPNIEDVIEWTQENNVSIRERNTFYYNFNYSKATTALSSRTLPFTYNREEYDCIFDSENGVMYSLPDRSENDLSDPWLIYRPLDTYQFNNYYGKLRELRGIETQQVLARFDNQHAIFNAVDVLVDGIDSTQAQLGSGGIFARRPVTFNETDLGYGGSQTYQMVSCEFGHFFADAMRGQVFQVMPGGKQSMEISKYSNGKSNGMYNWFKEHLPFKIRNSRITNYENIDTDNALNGIGITMGYDSRYSRVFLTKIDYIPLQNMTYMDGNFFNAQDEIVQLTDPAYFENCSFTIAYSLITNGWISYYSFKPNYYLNHNNYFQTGINQSGDTSELGLWSHLLTNKSYQVFYGKKYPWIIEVPVKNEFVTKRLENTSIWMDVKRYHNEYDFSYDKNITFNKAWIYNHRENSGQLNLVPQTSFYQARKYPITNRDNTQDVIITNQDHNWTLNYIYNRTISEDNNLPLWIWDCNQIDKTVNNKAVKFGGKKVLEYMRGNWFLIRLQQDKTSQYNLTYNWGMTKNELY